MNDKAREAFEREYEAYCLPVEADWFRREEGDPDEYYHLTTKEAWWGFRAALQWAASQQPDAKAWAVLNEDGDVSMLFLDRAEALTYCGEGEQPVPMVFGGAAAPAQQAAEGWRPIETAPKDGECLVYMPNERSKIQAARFHPNVKVIGGAFSFDLTDPTHWMPLPAAPTAQGEREPFKPGEYERMTENGRKAWAGVDPQSLRDGSHQPQGERDEQ